MAALVEQSMIEPDTRKIDPWETPDIFDCSDNTVLIYSAGPDQQERIEDDIR